MELYYHGLFEIILMAQFCRIDMDRIGIVTSCGAGDCFKVWYLCSTTQLHL